MGLRSVSSYLQDLSHEERSCETLPSVSTRKLERGKEGISPVNPWNPWEGRLTVCRIGENGYHCWEAGKCVLCGEECKHYFKCEEHQYSHIAVVREKCQICGHDRTYDRTLRDFKLKCLSRPKRTIDVDNSYDPARRQRRFRH